MNAQFLSFFLSTGRVVGVSVQMDYSANVPGNEHILATKVLMPGGGEGSGHMHFLANVPKKILMPGNISECHAISLPVISLLTYCLKEVLKACACLHSQAVRHSGTLAPPPQGMDTIWLMSQGMSTFWLRTPPPPGDEHFLAYQREVCNRYSNWLLLYDTIVFFSTDVFIHIHTFVESIRIKFQ